MALGNIIFSEKNNDDNTARIVEVGRWNTIPTGPWCALNPLETIKRDACNRIVLNSYIPSAKLVFPLSAPIVSTHGACWWSFHTANNNIYIAYYRVQRRPKKFINRLPFATLEDTWSFVRNEHGGAAYFATVYGIDGTDSIDQDTNQITDFRRVPPAHVAQLDELLTCAFGANRAAEITAPLHALHTQKMENKKKKAAETRAKTHANKDRGGNPHAFELGDCVVTLSPHHQFKGENEPRRKFFYAQHAYYDDTIGFFAQINAKGRGLGSRYPIKKKEVVRACQTGFDLLWYTLTAHEKIDLLAAQAQVEEIRANQDLQQILVAS